LHFGKTKIFSSVAAVLLLVTGCGNSELQQDPRTSKYAHLLDEKYEIAAKQLDEELQRNPNDLQAQYYRGAVEIEGGHVENAIERLSKLVEKYPKYSFGYSERSRAYRKAGNYESALVDADLSIRYRPDVARNYVRRALIFGLMHNPEKAIEDVRMATKLGPEEDASLVKVIHARSLMDLHRYQEALPLLDDVIAKSKNDVRAIVQRGTCYAYLKDWPKAISDADTALKIAPKDPGARMLHVALLSATGKRAEARQEWPAIFKDNQDAKVIVEAIDIGPDVPSAADAALVAVTSGQARLGQAILNRVQGRRPLDASELFALAKAQLEQKDYYRAAKMLNECLAVEPTWGEPRAELIKLYEKDGLPQKARAVQKEGLQLPLSAADRKVVAAALQ
jgi:tetratricopeptide (TPR) repeat protein